jgi:adenosylmethionine-8-amino-7-oxononanoate aminotransferase
VTVQTVSGGLFSLDPNRTYPILDRAEGVYVWDSEGRRYLDAIAGIAVANIGYGRQEVVEAIARQAARLPFAAANIFESQPTRQLAELVARWTPGDLDYVHFTSGGSEAVEVAIKLARQFHVLRGEPERSVIVSRWNGYHGATLGALSVGGSRLRRRIYEPMLQETPHIPAPYCYRCPWPTDHPDCAHPAAAALEEAILAVGAHRIAAFIAEPIVASVGGAIRPQDGYWPEIREICDRYGVLLITDEILTGFGRTGRPFAVDHWGIVPDILVMGKGIGGGYVPLGAVAARSFVRQGFIDAKSAFDHIFTFGGHPVSTAAGIAVLEIWEREDLTQRVAEREATFADLLGELRDFRWVGDVRVSGFMAGIEFVADRDRREPFPAELGIGLKVREAGLRHGIVTYPGAGMADGTRGDIVSLYPPLTIGDEELTEMGQRLYATFEEVDGTLYR